MPPPGKFFAGRKCVVTRCVAGRKTVVRQSPVLCTILSTQSYLITQLFLRRIGPSTHQARERIRSSTDIGGIPAGNYSAWKPPPARPWSIRRKCSRHRNRRLRPADRIRRLHALAGHVGLDRHI